MPSLDAVAVEFDLTREEYLSAHRLAMSRQPVGLVLPALGAALVAAGVLTTGQYAVPGVALLVGGFWVWWGASRQRWRRDPAQAGPFTYRFDGTGIAITSRAGSVALPWARVRKVTIGKRLVVLQVGGSGIVVPWRAVAPADRGQLEKLLREH